MRTYRSTANKNIQNMIRRIREYIVRICRISNICNLKLILIYLQFVQPTLNTMGPPTKRSMTELKSISPSKCTNTRKVVFIHAGATADGTIAIIKASKEGRQDNDEPFTNPARLAIVSGMGTDAPNELVQAGFFMVASKTMNETSDIPHRTSRGYDYKVFLASVDENLTVNGFAGLKNIALRFADVSKFSTENRTVIQISISQQIS